MRTHWCVIVKLSIYDCCCDALRHCCVPERCINRHISDKKALQIALGNVNVNTGERLADYDPDTAVKVGHSLAVCHHRLLLLLLRMNVIATL